MKKFKDYLGKSELAIHISERDFSFNMDEMFSIETTPESVSRALENNPADYTWMAMIKAKASFDVRKKKMALECLEAKLDKDARANVVGAEGTKVKLPTDKSVEKVIMRDETWQVSKTTLNQAIYNEDVVSAIVEGLRQKHMSAVSLAGLLKQEFRMIEN